MSMGRSDSPIRRYVIHALMVILVLVAVTPIYVLIINATRTTEQINQGLSLLPGSGAFWSTTSERYAEWGTGDDGRVAESADVPMEGTVRYIDLIRNETFREEVNKKTGKTEIRVMKKRTESRQPRITIVDDAGERLASYPLYDNATIYVEEGVKVKRGVMADGKMTKGTLIARVVTPPNVLYNWRALTERGFKIWQGFGNSTFIAVFVTLLCVYFSGLTAYGLHVYRFKGRTAIWAIILVIMMLPGSLTFIGFVQLMSRWRLTDTYIPLIIPGIAAATTVLFIRQYMSSVLSFELIDAARIDGAGEYRIFNTIIVPVIIPALAAQAIFTFVGSWNNFLTPFVIISSREKYTLPMLIQALRGDIYRTEFGGIYLGIAVSLIPIILFYCFMSRFIISGLTMGGIKE